MTVLEIVEAFLETHNLDGLANTRGECACLLGDLAPCGCMDERCVAGVREPCDCGEGHGYHIVEKTVLAERAEEEEALLRADALRADVDRLRWRSRETEAPPKTGEWVEFWWASWSSSAVVSPVWVLRWVDDFWRDDMGNKIALCSTFTNWRLVAGPE